MDEEQRAGNIVLLNGTSSAGKTSIARALQDVMETPYLHTGVDFWPHLPQRFRLISDGREPASADYLLMVYSGHVERVTAVVDGREVVYGLGTLEEVRIGPKGVRVFAGVYRAVAAMAASGLDLIVDDCIYDPRVLAAAAQALCDANALFVGLRLPLAEAERRERERGDRGPGGAAAFYELVHAHSLYDLELDTSQLEPKACALRIKDALEGGHPRTALRTLATRPYPAL